MAEMVEIQAFVYILHCADGSYYVGSHRGADVTDRVNGHNMGIHKDAYTFTRRPVCCVWSGDFPTFVEAVAFERQLKGWSRKKKEAFICGDFDALRFESKRPGAKRKTQPSS